LLIRTVGADEVELCRHLGEMVRAAYVTLPGHVPEPEYEEELADVASRAGLLDTEVLAAFDDDGTPLGCVTYVASTKSPMAEGLREGQGQFRMLGVGTERQRRGAGRALVEACVELAREAGRDEVILHTTTWMLAAHRLYESLGFVRDDTLDWAPLPEICLVGYRLALPGAPAS
jgi:ribosomal protein S18 acetylase RimI-like enzyme